MPLWRLFPPPPYTSIGGDTVETPRWTLQSKMGWALIPEYIWAIVRFLEKLRALHKTEQQWAGMVENNFQERWLTGWARVTLQPKSCQEGTGKIAKSFWESKMGLRWRSWEMSDCHYFYQGHRVSRSDSCGTRRFGHKQWYSRYRVWCSGPDEIDHFSVWNTEDKW